VPARRAFIISEPLQECPLADSMPSAWQDLAVALQVPWAGTGVPSCFPRVVAARPTSQGGCMGNYLLKYLLKSSWQGKSCYSQPSCDMLPKPCHSFCSAPIGIAAPHTSFGLVYTLCSVELRLLALCRVLARASAAFGHGERGSLQSGPEGHSWRHKQYSCPSAGLGPDGSVALLQRDAHHFAGAAKRPRCH